MEFRILGPLEVVEDGRQVAVGGPKHRQLLAVLLLHANDVVSTDRLIDALWEDSPPERAQKALQVYVSHLRKALGRHRLQTKVPGYVLRVHEAELDVDRFQRLREDGELAAALALWRGPALSDFALNRFAQPDIARLEELRLTTLEDRIDQDLALGRHADLVGELQALVREHPLRERPCGQLMVALYRSGRQAEALEAYQEARRVLVEELGIEPGRALRDLEKAILLQDPALDAPSLGEEPRSEAERRSVFVGRKAEVHVLASALDGMLAGHGGVVLIAGEPGIGKSRLCDDAIVRARGHGARILVGRCWEAGGAPAYWPWVQVLRTYVRDSEEDVVRAHAGAGAAEIAQMLPELRSLFPDLPEPPSAELESARFRLFDATASFLKRAAASQPLLLVLDDLHAADTPSLLMLEFLAGEVADSRILVLGAFRDVDPTLREPLSATLTYLGRQPVATRLALGGLAVTEVADFIQLAAGVSPSEALVETIHVETDGNPLFVGEVVRLLAQEGLLEGGREDVERLGVPGGVREVIGRRLSHLSEECRRILTLASVLGREFALAGLEHVSGLRLEQLLDALEEAMSERVVGEVPGSPGRLRFAHALIRDTIYEDLTAVRRMGLHRLVGKALETLYAEDPEPHLAELAHHFFAAAPAGEEGRALSYARQAGDRAASLLAFEEAARLYQMGLTLAPDDVGRCDLLIALGDAQAREGDEPAAKATFLQAADLARRLEVTEQLARAALGYGGRFVWARAGTDEHLIPLLEDALSALGEQESALRVRLMARLAGALRDQHTRKPRAALSEKAVEMARRIGDLETLAYALDGRLMATFWAENTEERIALASELVRLADEVGDVEREAAARYYRMMFQLELGDMDAVESGLEDYAARAEELRQPAQLWLLVVTRATLALFQGRFEEGERLADEALSLGGPAQRSDAVLSNRIHRFTLARERGGLDAVENEIASSIAEYPARPMFRCMLAALYADLSRESQARNLLEELAADDFAALPRTNEWLFSLGFLAEVTASLGDVDRAAVLYRSLAPYAARNACTPDYIVTGSVSRYLGLLATVLEGWEKAERHYEDALEMNARMGARPLHAHTQEDYARMLFVRGEPGDAERARELVEQALTTYRELGMHAPLSKAEELLARRSEQPTV